MSNTLPQPTRSLFDKWFSRDFGIVIAVAAATVAIIGFFNSLVQKEIANLRDNHIHTIEETLDRNEEDIELIKQSLIRIETQLEERLPKE